jgi:hypothetical protein
MGGAGWIFIVRRDQTGQNYKMRRLIRRPIAIVLLALILLYSLGYVVCRMNKSIVHYTATAGGRCSFHGVDAGDYKLGTVAPMIEAFYTPLRYAELAYWKLARPTGGNC